MSLAHTAQATVAQETASWDRPTTVAPRATVIVLPGRGEHPGLYQRLGRRLASDGYPVRVVGDPELDPVGVTRAVRDVLADETLTAPRVLVGSDTGALFAAGLVARGDVEVDALVLVGLPVPGDTVTAGGTDEEIEVRTACGAHRALLGADDRFRAGALATPPPTAWFADADLARVGVPVLAIHGEADTVSPLAAARERYAAAADLELEVVVEGLHDALNDQTHRSVAATVVLFVERLRQGPARPAIVRRDL